MIKFEHLEYAKQSYLQHLQDSFFYSWMSLKSSFYFFFHGLYPDIFKTNGSQTIVELHDIIQEKIESIQN